MIPQRAALIALCLCAGLTLEADPAAARVVHSVTGSGKVIENPNYRLSVAAHQDEQGRTWGVVIIVVDLSSFGLGYVTLHGDVTCLQVSGSAAWVGGTITHSTAPELLPVGGPMLSVIHDLGGNGDDRAHAEFLFPTGPCTDEPPLPADQVINGNFHVR